MIGLTLAALFLMGFGVVFFALFTMVPFLLAWNYISPTFGLPYLDWLQALAILVALYAIGAGFKSTTTK